MPREHGHRVRGDSPEEFAEDASLFVEQIEAARALFLKHERERKLLDERQFQAIEVALRTAHDSPWMDTTAASAYLGMSVKRLHELTGRRCFGPNRVPFSLVGNRKTFHRERLDNWLLKREQ